ncbi:hypothetical protein ABK040_004380 [Willaertia magna]
MDNEIGHTLAVRRKGSLKSERNFRETKLRRSQSSILRHVETIPSPRYTSPRLNSNSNPNSPKSSPKDKEKKFGNFRKGVIYESLKQEIENQKKEIARKLVLMDYKEKKPKRLSGSTFGEVAAGIVSADDFGPPSSSSNTSSPRTSAVFNREIVENGDTPRTPKESSLHKFQQAVKQVIKTNEVIKRFEWGKDHSGIVNPVEQKDIKLNIKKGDIKLGKKSAEKQVRQKYNVENNKKTLEDAKMLRIKGYKMLDSETIQSIERFMLIHEKSFSPKCMIDAYVKDGILKHQFNPNEIRFHSESKYRSRDDSNEN